VIAPTGPSALIGCCEQSIHLWTGEKADHGARETLAWDRKDPLDLCGTLWNLERGITKEGMDRRQAQITSSDTDAIVLFQVIEKVVDKGRRDLFESQFRWCSMQAMLSEF